MIPLKSYLWYHKYPYSYPYHAYVYYPYYPYYPYYLTIPKKMPLHLTPLPSFLPVSFACCSTSISSSIVPHFRCKRCRVERAVER